jgi:hypothetical protein
MGDGRIISADRGGYNDLMILFLCVLKICKACNAVSQGGTSAGI